MTEKKPRERICPHCHQLMPPELTVDNKVQQRLLDFIIKRPGASVADIKKHLRAHYYHDADWPTPDAIAIIVNKINYVIKDRGYKIRGRQGSNGGYKLFTFQRRSGFKTMREDNNAASVARHD